MRKKKGNWQGAVSAQSEFEEKFPVMTSLGCHAGHSVWEILEIIAAKVVATHNGAP